MSNPNGQYNAYSQVPNGYPTQPPKKGVPTWVKVAGGVIGGFVVLGACATILSDSEPNKPSVQVPNAAPEVQANQAEPAAPVASPLNTDGKYLVGSEIQPGTYRVVPAEDSYGMGYWARCADLECSIDFDGKKSTGLIENDAPSGPDFLVIEPTDVAVELRGLVLTPA